MRERLGLGIVTLLLLATPASADWRMSGANAPHTGAVDARAPEWPDVAWTVQLPGSRSPFSTPIVLGRDVYVLLEDRALREDLREPGIWRIPLDTGEPTLVATTPGRSWGWATDGGSFYVVGDGVVNAFPRDGGPARWTWTAPDLVGGVGAHFCMFPKAAGDALYVACLQHHERRPGGTPAGSMLYAVSLDTGTGEVRWLWQRDAWAVANASAPVAVPADVYAPMGGFGLNGLALVGPTLLLAGADVVSTAGIAQAHVWGLDARTGRFLWRQSSEGARTAVPIAGEPTGDGTLAYLKLVDLRVVNVQTGNIVWGERLGREDTTEDVGGAGFALASDALYVATAESVYRVDTTTRETVWRRTLPAELDHRWSATAMLLSSDRVLLLRSTNATAHWTRLHALDAATGATLWTSEANVSVGSIPYQTAVHDALAEGVAVEAWIDGTVRALGRTATSPTVRLRADTLYPAPGEEVEVDLSRSLAGSQGGLVGFRADWGDGTTSGWTTEPVLRHAYAEPGEHAARFHVRSASGRSASATATMAVGADAPNFVSEAFSPERQELTFFVLGLALTAAGGGWSLWRAQRRRRTLAALLASVEATAKRAPHDLERALAARLTEARSVAVAGRLDAAQLAVVERRVEELARAARTHRIEEDFPFLPVSLVRALQEMLGDGRVTRWEREQFKVALERDVVLAPEQKVRVAALVDEWFARDADAPP